MYIICVNLWENVRNNKKTSDTQAHIVNAICIYNVCVLCVKNNICNNNNIINVMLCS